MNVRGRVVSMLGRILSADLQGANATFRLTPENGIAPIDVAKLAIALEQTFGVSLADEHIAQWETLGDACEHVEELLEEGQAEPAIRTDAERAAWFYA